MSERILRALMQLFAIIAKVEVVPEKADGENDSGEENQPHAVGEGRDIVKLFLKQRLNQELVEEYLQVFDQYLEKHQKISKRKKGDQKKKGISVNSVKVLRICTDINAELTQKQKIVVFIRLLEFISSGDDVTDQELEFVSTVADTFNIPKEEFDICKSFIESSEDTQEDISNLLFVDNNKSHEEKFEYTKHFTSEGLTGQVRVLRIPSVNMFLFRYFGPNELYLNGQLINNRNTYILTNGSSIRSSLIQPIYYSDVINSFLSDTASEKIVFKAEHISYTFPNGGVGLHDLTISEESGKLCGIMGGSGAGKSTLLNVLNGNHPPSTGAVKVNNIDIHFENNDIEGVIGYISQDDLLIEELTVFENLFYNSKLCFDRYSDAQIAKMVLRLLKSLGLYEIKDLKVGSPLDKTISGGQRKRLNIGLELIREPSVLFVDEPTSGLSSRDSENIMDLLKELALKGKLVFVVIHQPSSDIFKMFDKLLILDQGGYPIYNGDPVDSIIYFKQEVDHINSSESECPTCGNVNPEQIFNIIESKVVDEFGNLTSKRKVAPKEWYESYKKNIGNSSKEMEEVDEKPQSAFKIPNVFKQFKVFFTRDILSKYTNKQYMLINFLEAPVLAGILAFFVKFYTMGDGSMEYVFRENVNIPSYLFIAVIVALFLGLTVSAEEIIRDQKILQRESFLNLSRGSYLLSKVTIMFLISAIQTVLFVVVGNLVLEIHGMFLTYWAILFSTSCFANMLGLNISASFNSAKVIYILIPLLIIPQLLFSGVIVKFDELYPSFSSQKEVPLIGNIMASRWAFEGLAVTQFKDNEFEENLYPYNKWLKFANWKKDFWIKEMRESLSDVQEHLDNKDSETFRSSLTILQNEFQKEKNLKEMDLIEGIEWPSLKVQDQLTREDISKKAIGEAKKIITQLFEIYKRIYKDFEAKKENKIYELTKTDTLKKTFIQLKKNHTNGKLETFVTNKRSFVQLVKYDGELIQKSNPVYLTPYHSSFFDAHFYAPEKKFFGNKFIDTFWANVMVLWLMSIILLIMLYFDALKKFLSAFGKIGELKHIFSSKKA